METIEQIVSRIVAALPEAQAEAIRVIGNAAVPDQASLLVRHECAVAVARFLKEDAALRLDYCSDVTGMDWPDRTVKTTTKTMQVVEGVEKEVETTTEELQPGYLEAVYILYSMSLKHGPVILRLRTADRAEGTHVPSLTPVWKSAEFQEREAYDLYGIQFDGHPDLRRILMWDEFTDFPMRKDYREPDDYEYEPTPHDEIVEKAARHGTTAAQPFPGA